MPGTTITGRTSGTAGSVSGSPGITDVTYRYMRAGTAFIINDWLTSLVATDTNQNFLDVSDATLTTFELVNTGAFSGAFEFSVDGGKNFFPLVPDAGSTGTTNPITAPGIYKFTGGYQYIRFVSTAIGTNLKISASFVRL